MSYYYGQASKKVRLSLHRNLQRLVDEVIKHRDCSLREGHRGEALQNFYFDSGASKVRWPDSKHNHLPSLAVDMYPHPITEEELHSREFWVEWGSWVCGLAAGLGIKLRWGYDWDMDYDLTDQTFNDGPHFELLEE